MSRDDGNRTTGRQLQCNVPADAKKDGRCEEDLGDDHGVSRALAQPRWRRSLRRTAGLPAAHFFHYGLGFLIDGQV